ncbi:hypothetical protein BCD48_25860 [Pseudofrankia sp. BMG5.36]|nr:hypothetical protein BCD48_25860 [Pseudofrankia sp. BMG5.36]
MRRVDPRDTTWELGNPVYRVYFWTRPAHSNASPSSTEFEITETDVPAVLDWARRTAGNRTFVVYAVCGTADGRKGLVRLAGQDPTRGAAAAGTISGARPSARSL